MKTLKDIGSFEGVKVLLRTDFNVPIRNDRVTDDFRIRMALPTINYLTERKAKVIIISHAESNDGLSNSLQPVADHLKILGHEVLFRKNFRNAMPVIDQELKMGQCMLFENLRMFGGGEKNNDEKFAKELASLADIYVNEAFPVSHREHASIVGVPKFLPSYAGLQVEKEVEHLSRAFKPTHPFMFILGGAKFETKLPLIDRFMKIADTVFVGGALAHNFFKEKKYELGRSLYSEADMNLGKFLKSPKLLLPVDIVDDDNKTLAPNKLSSDRKIVDAGPETLKLLKEKIDSAKFILWNGPLGFYESEHTQPTLDLAKMIADATDRGAETIVGGGDTIAAITATGLQNKFTFISTGGGAMLDFLAKGTLPGIQALEKSEA
jgi:phosphoglycerate kinase